MPLYNYANKQIGVVAIAVSFEEDKRLARRSLVWQVLAAIFALVVLAGAIIVVIRGVVLSPLATISDRMRALAEGDASRPAESLDSYCEELETLAKSYEQLRTQRKS
jgi:nitrate/nitrite-specific signal transduction histidine kinase